MQKEYFMEGFGDLEFFREYRDIKIWVAFTLI